MNGATTRFYFRPSSIAPAYVCIAALSLFLIWDPFPSRYFSALQRPPGVFVIYALVAGFVLVLIWKLPTLVRALARIPAVEFDGETLLIRGWEDRRFSIEPDKPVSIHVDGSGRLVVSAAGQRPAHIYLHHIDGRGSLVSFLRDLAGSPAV